MHRMKVRSLFWPAPDALLTAAGSRGEVLVARIRLLLTSVLLFIPVVNALFTSERQEVRIGFGLTATAFLLSALAYPLVVRGFAYPWIAFATSAFDVSLVSGGLALFLVLGRPHTAVNSKVVFEAYFLAIGATCLRYDRRVCLVAGLLACGEYLAIVSYAATYWDLNSPLYAPFAYGMFSWNTQLSRLIVMVAACFLSIAVVTRTQELLRRSIRDPLTGLVN